MGVRIIDGNLFESKAKYICHQVNCQGKMGSGVARMIRERYPMVFSEYYELCKSEVEKTLLLGHAQIVRCGQGESEACICNLFGQLNYGYDGKVYTDYRALRKSVRQMKKQIPKGETIAFPFKIGCGLGGADWNQVSSMIERELGDDYNVEFWRWNPNGKRKSSKG